MSRIRDRIRAMKSGALLLLAALTLHAQPAMEIVGRVTEPGTNLGIYDATVTISRMESRGPTLTEAHIEVAKLTTNAQGEFRYTVIDAARYWVQAEKKGFQQIFAIIPSSGAGSQITIEVTPTAPRREVTLALGQSGTITGRAIDAETGEPLSALVLMFMATDTSTATH